MLVSKAIDALVVSDLHLSPRAPKTSAAFLTWLSQQTGQAKQAKQVHAASNSPRAVYLLGDVFEYWVGDEMLDDSFYADIAAAIKNCVMHGIKVYWCDGNRDFLVRARFFEMTACQRLNDPQVHILGGVPTLLTHGDQYCLDDVAYMTFRGQVRNPDFQTQFLARSFAERHEIIQKIRTQSAMTSDISDVHHATIRQLFNEHQVTRLVHGHTHQSAMHQVDLETHCTRWVLSDWDFDHAPTPRANAWAAYTDGSCGFIPIVVS